VTHNNSVPMNNRRIARQCSVCPKQDADELFQIVEGLYQVLPTVFLLSSSMTHTRLPVTQRKAKRGVRMIDLKVHKIENFLAPNLNFVLFHC
jgi:hypothetical protein